MSNPKKAAAAFLNQQLHSQSQQQMDDEMEVATISTQMGNLFEEETNQLRELIREKEQAVEALTKEKNYYIRKCEQQLKQIQQQANQSLSNHNAHTL